MKELDFPPYWSTLTTISLSVGAFYARSNRPRKNLHNGINWSLRSLESIDMAEAKTADDPLAGLPTAKDVMKQIALREAEKASAAVKEMNAAEAEKKALMERFSKPSGVSDEDRLARAAAIIKRAANNGMTEVLVVRFPNELCTDRGRAINQQEPGWENTLTGLPKELFEFWQKHMKPRGYRLRFQIIDFPGGVPGDIGVTLSWQ